MNKKKNTKVINTAKEIVAFLESKQLPEEIMQDALKRLDKLITATQDMKTRVDILNMELQKIAYFN
ncbi:MAG: hypothetical protein HZB18_14860 [Chloroflexi bacterium]|nr:hypothetical protein [Chloroflexota bacterium]